MSLPDMHQSAPLPDRSLEALKDLLATGDLFRYTAPKDAPVTLLEQEFASLLGSQYALAVSSCSAALFLSLKALDLPRGAPVLIPGFTFAAVPSAVIHADCKPVLCEVGQNYRIDLDDFAAKLSAVSAVIISHMRGHTSDMDTILRLCHARNIPVIEDAAHSLGTTWHDRNIGTLGTIGCFSFQSYKMINAGEGGILITDDPDLAARMIIMSGAYEHSWQKHGLDASFFAPHQNQLPLYNLRMSNLAAAVVRPQLPELQDRVVRGRRNHDHIVARLADHPLLQVPPAYAAEERAPDSLQFNLSGIDPSAPAAFVQAAAKEGLKIQIFGQSQDNARAFWNWQFIDDLPKLPKTRAMLMRACDLRLPVHLSLAQCDLVAEALLRAAASLPAANLAAE